MLNNAAFDTIAGMLKTRSGLALGPDKLYLLESRLGGLLKQHGLRDLGALAGKLTGFGQDSLARDVVEAMTTNESFFFRDGKPFDHVRNHVVGRLHAARPAGQKIRIWSAAASSGQEAYSLAMIICEMRAQLGERAFELLGTDIAREHLARAREATYSQFEVQRGLPMQMLVKYFKREGTLWRLDAKLRAMAQFRDFNLLDDPRVLGKFDIVFCRNVLIYFDPPTKARVLNGIADQMAPDGVLYLGGAETVLGVTDRFAPMPGEHGVYLPVPRKA